MRVQMAFLLDRTQSMQNWIDTCKDEILDLIAKTTGVELETALVAYSDYDDDGYHAPLVVPFSGDPVPIKNALSQIVAYGGNDCAEDVAGGIHALHQLAWDPDVVQHVVHLADAPPHGMEFHEPWVNDNFPNGDPSGKNLIELLERIDGVNYTFFKITENTDVFVKLLEDIFPTFNLVDLKEREYTRMGVRMRVGDLDDYTFSGVLSQIVMTTNPSLPSASQSDPA
jgi:hypothetical protein